MDVGSSNMKHKFTGEICVYCNKAPSETKDHTIGRKFFLESRSYQCILREEKVQPFQASSACPLCRLMNLVFDLPNNLVAVVRVWRHNCRSSVLDWRVGFAFHGATAPFGLLQDGDVGNCTCGTPIRRKRSAKRGSEWRLSNLGSMLTSTTTRRTKPFSKAANAASLSPSIA